MAYTLLDADSPIPESGLAAIAGIEGMLAVRAISSEGQ
jgi:hypothetical protein